MGGVIPRRGLVLHDLRFALRGLRRDPGFAGIAVLTLALGVGANTTVFSLGNWIAWRPVPGVHDPGSLVTVQFLRFRHGAPPSGTAISYPDIHDFAEGSPAMSGMGAYNPGNFGLAPSGQRARLVEGAYVTQNYFSLLGVRFQAGGPFTAEQERAAATSPMAVISYALWERAFGKDRGIVGRPVRLNDVAVTVAGVTAPAFRGTRLLGADDVWMPISAQRTMNHRPPWDLLALRGPGKTFNQPIGRLAPGATPRQAQAQLDLVSARLARAYPAEDGGFVDRTAVVRRGIGVPPRERDALGQALRVLTVIGGLILLIALANVGNLCLLRTARHRTEFAVHSALGAGPGRILRRNVAETLLLAAAGGVVGISATVLLVRLFSGLAVSPLEMTGDVNPIGEVGIDWRVLAYTVGLVMSAGIAVGLLPGLWLRRAHLALALKSGAARGSAGGHRLRSVIAVAQVAGSLVLVVGALLLVGTLRNLRRIPLGFDARRVHIFWMSASSGGYSYDRTRTVVPELLARVRSIPEIEDVGLTYAAPFSGINLGIGVRAQGTPLSDSAVSTTNMWVSPTYFSTLGIPFRAGGPFTDADMAVLTPGRDGAAVISESLAIRLFGRSDPIGRRVITRGGMSGDSVTYRVVGVVADSKWNALTGEERLGPLFFRPLGDDGMRSNLAVVTRSRRPAATRGAVERVLAEVVPTVPVYLSTTLEDQVNTHLSNQRLFAGVGSACMVAALLLAAVGLYVLVASAVAEQTRALGIRVALGARREQILGMVLVQGARQAGIGVLLGLAGAPMLSRILTSRLYGLSPLQPAVYLAAALLLLTVALCASIWPAFRATRVNPMVALRAE